MHELARYLFLAAAALFVVLGALHGTWTLRDTRTPTAFSPTDPGLREAMLKSGLLLTRRANMWQAWLGFNLSHSLGLVLLGIALLLVGRTEAEFQRQVGLFLPFALAASLGYLVLAVKYWFWAPALGIAVSVLCLLLSGLARLAGQ